MSKLHVNAIDLNYEIAGDGEPILFVHGLGSSGRDWEQQIPYFSKHYQTVAFDLRGHGQSSKPPGPYTMRLFASDTAELIKSLSIAPVHVVGISLGGMIAFQLAVDNPDLIKTLTIVNLGPAVMVRTMKDRWDVFMRFAIVRLMGMRKMGEVLSERLFPKEQHADLRKRFIEHWAENDPRAYTNTLRAIVGWSVADRLDRIHVPTLIIAADQDYTPVSAKEAYLTHLSQAELAVIKDSHHATPVECPAEFNEAVMAFLSKHRND